MFAQVHGEATATGTRLGKTCTLPQAVQRHDELRAKKAGAWAGVMTRPVSPITVSTNSALCVPALPGPSIVRPCLDRTVLLQSRTAARASAILPMARLLPCPTRYPEAPRPW